MVCILFSLHTIVSTKNGLYIARCVRLVPGSDGQQKWYVKNVFHDYEFSLFSNFDELVPADPRVKDWPMMSSPFPTMALCIFYAYFSKVLAPKLMANRKAFDLRNILVVYNLFQTVFSAWIFYEVSTV